MICAESTSRRFNAERWSIAGIGPLLPALSRSEAQAPMLRQSFNARASPASHPLAVGRIAAITQTILKGWAKPQSP